MRKAVPLAAALATAVGLSACSTQDHVYTGDPEWPRDQAVMIEMDADGVGGLATVNGVPVTVSEDGANFVARVGTDLLQKETGNIITVQLGLPQAGDAVVRRLRITTPNEVLMDVGSDAEPPIPVHLPFSHSIVVGDEPIQAPLDPEIITELTDHVETVRTALAEAASERDAKKIRGILKPTMSTMAEATGVRLTDYGFPELRQDTLDEAVAVDLPVPVNKNQVMVGQAGAGRYIIQSRDRISGILTFKVDGVDYGIKSPIIEMGVEGWEIIGDAGLVRDRL